MTSGTRIGILGGTLDPIHLGHLDTALAARDALALDSVLVLPSHASPSPGAAARVAVSPIRDGGARRERRDRGCWRATWRFGAPGPSYTADTLDAPARGAAWRHRRFSSSPGPTRSQKSKRGTAIRRSWSSRTSWSCRDPATRPRRFREASRAGGADAYRGLASTAVGVLGPPDRSPGPRGSARGCADTRRVVHGRSGGASKRAHPSRVWCPPRSRPTSGNTVSTGR